LRPPTQAIAVSRLRRTDVVAGLRATGPRIGRRRHGVAGGECGWRTLPVMPQLPVPPVLSLSGGERHPRTWCVSPRAIRDVPSPPVEGR
jgi:hypothetical protein